MSTQRMIPHAKNSGNSDKFNNLRRIPEAPPEAIQAQCDPTFRTFLLRQEWIGHRLESVRLTPRGTLKWHFYGPHPDALRQDAAEQHRDARRKKLRKSVRLQLSQLDPHSDEWFAAYHAYLPTVADWVGNVVSVSGRSDGCSICGDSPAPVYEDHEFPYLPLRLCDYCVDMLRVMGERLTLREAES